MKAVILAGGYGTRISEESCLRPKPMIEIGGAPILWHILKYYSHFGVSDFIICCGYKGFMIKKYFADYYLHHSDVTFDFANGGKVEVHSNAAEPWRVTVVDTGLDTQTGGRIWKIRKYVEGERFLMTYGDGVSNIDLPELLDTHSKSGKAVTISAVQPGGRFGMININGRDGTVIGFREKSKEDGGWINAGFMVMEPEAFDYLDSGSVLERAPMERLCADGKLGAYRHYGFWACMDTQRDKDALEEQWSGGSPAWKLWK